jgi:hypothetical protein
MPVAETRNSKIEIRKSEKTLLAFVESIFDFQASAPPRSEFPLARG